MSKRSDKKAEKEEVSLDSIRSAYETVSKASPEIQDAFRIIKDHLRTETKATLKRAAALETEMAKLDKALRNQQLELGQRKFYIVELQTALRKAEQLEHNHPKPSGFGSRGTSQTNTHSARKPRGIGRRSVPYIPDGRKYP